MKLYEEKSLTAEIFSFVETILTFMFVTNVRVVSVESAGNYILISQCSISKQNIYIHCIHLPSNTFVRFYFLQIVKKRMAVDANRLILTYD